MLNGPLDDDTLLPFLDGLVSAGYEGVCFHPGDGLLVPYASRHYWARLDALIGEARARGLEVWHYDELPYPSGTFGGVIPDEPGARVRGLEFEEVPTLPDGNGLIDVGTGALLALLRRDIAGAWNDVTADCGPHFDTWVCGDWHNRFYTGTYNVHEELHERASANRATTAYLPAEPMRSGEQLLAVKVVNAKGQKATAGQADVTLPEVTDRFLEAAYQPLADISRRHGLSDTPVFQDEVTFHAPFLWNRLVEQGLRELWGAEWKTRLPGLHFAHGPGWEGTRLDYRRLTARLLEENWFARVATWCSANGLRMTGHLPGEESVVGHWNYLGEAFRSLSHFDIPGYDSISSFIADDQNRGQALGAKLVQSAAWLDGGKPTMAEVFGANSFAAGLQENRSVLAWLALHDITRVFDHSTYSCALSLRKYDAPPVNNRFNPQQPGRSELWKWHAWLCDLLEEFSFAPDRLIVFPSASLARFQITEWEQWRGEASLLETWFHYAFASSLDAILLPEERLDEVALQAEGFGLHGRSFRRLWVPPTPSLSGETVQQLRRFEGHEGYLRFVPTSGQTTFDSPEPPLTGRVVAVDEAQLVERGAGFFDALSRSPLSGFSAPRTLLKSLRRNAAGATMLVLQNPHDDALEVTCTRTPGTALHAPIGGLSSPVEAVGEAFRLVLAPREVALFRQDVAPATQMLGVGLLPQRERWRCLADNHLSLKTGTVRLEKQAERSFLPAPASSLWPLDLPYNVDSDAVYAPPYSFAPLAEPLELEAAFPVTLEEALPALAVVWDAESLPPGAALKWDDRLLRGEKRDVYERGNQVSPIPAELLTRGAHVLRVEAHVTNGAQGLLERPILTGRFLARDAQNAVLRAAEEAWQPWEVGQTFDELGWPEGFGPVEHDFVFEISPCEAERKWWLQLPPMLGTAQVWINEQSLGLLSWEPRWLVVDGLRLGQNSVRISVSGSWNNLFSRLNRRPNGLTGSPSLRAVEQS